jgi:hypothetical protein
MPDSPNSRRRLLRIFVIILLLAATTLAAGVIYWTGAALHPSPTALAALQSNDLADVTLHSGLIVFEPAGSPAVTGFIFYPGAGVDYRSYAPVLRQVAAQGYLVALLQMPLNLAFFDTAAADGVITQFPAIEHWVVGGHSLGGVAAASYAAGSSAIEGLVLWASYPGNDALAGSSLKAVSIFGSLDGLSLPQTIAASRQNLPPGTQFVEIAGGNHAQFGSYGAQKGDNPASISEEEQAALVAAATVAFLQSVDSNR